MIRTGLLAATALLSFCSAACASAQEAPPPQIDAVRMAAPAEPDAIALYGEATPGSEDTETWAQYYGQYAVVRNVTRPTITPFLPDPARATGAAVLVAPGGAFMLLAIDPEGWRVARALNERGIAAFVLKYRVMPTPEDIAEATALMNQRTAEGVADPTRMPTIQYPPSTDDALAALALIRSRSAEWGIDPDRVGMMGFSAGAMTTLNTVLHGDGNLGPDFIGYIYGPQPRVEVPTDAPPMFNAIAFDDEFFPTMGFPIAEAWHAAGLPVEVHGYGRGGHGFNLGREGTTTPLMLEQFVAWMRSEGFLTEQAE